MATDLDDRPDTGSDSLNPGQQHYDDVFSDLTSKEHLAKDGKPGDSGDGGIKSTAKGLYNKGRDTRQSLRGRAGKFMKKKWVIGAAVGGGGLSLLVLLLLLLVATFKIPHLAENITAYQFARVTQQMSRNTSKILSEKISVASAQKIVFDKLENKYATVGKVKTAWTKLDKFRPNKIIANMQSSREAQLRYIPDKYGRPVLSSIQLDNSRIRVRNVTGAKKLIPGFKLANDIKFATKVAPRLNTAIKANAYGPIIRGSVAKKIRNELGVSLIAWKVGEFKGKSAEKARILVEQQSHKKISGNSKESIKTQPLKDAVAKAADEEAKAVASDEKVKQIIKNGGAIQGVASSITQSLKDSPFKSTLKFANGAYAVAVPICIVYEGSLEQSGPTIDQQTASQQKAYYLVASAGDQQKDGTDGSAEATGAYNDKLGDINGSNPMLRASGMPVDTSGYPSAEAGAGGGTFSIANAFGGKNKATDFVNWVAGNACPKLTDVKLAGAVAVLNVGAIVFSGGTAAGAEKAAQKAATTTVGKIAEKVAAGIIRKKGAVNVSGKIGDVVTGTVKSAGKIAAATILAKLIVMSKAGYTNNGLEQGSDFANMADSGGNIAGNELNRKQFYGRPFTKNEAASSAQQAVAFVKQQNETKSSYQRFFAISNPQSLLSRFSINTANTLSSVRIPSMLKQLGNMLNPVALFSSIMGHVNPQTVHAASAQDAASLNYGNIQFGFSPDEQAIMDNDTSYQYLENQKILDQYDEDGINDKYGKCFTDSLGDLLKNGDISLDENGNVKDESGALCSPRNLTYTNNEFGNQMVFRWRVAHSYDSTLDQLSDMQNITENGAGSSFRIATYNILGAGHTGGKYEGRADKVIDNIKANAIDIVGLQETTDRQRKYILSNLTNYEAYPTDGSQNPIIWDDSKYEAIEKSMQPNLTYICGPKLKAPYLLLNDRSTNQKFYVLNTHDPVSGNTASCASANRKATYKNALEHLKLMKSLETKDLPVLYTGDFNSKYALTTPDKNGYPYQGKVQNLTYCILTKDGAFVDAYDAYKKREVKCPNKTPPDSGAGIDHVFLSKNLIVNSFKGISGGANGSGPSGSDHPALIYGITIPGSGGETTSYSNPIIKSSAPDPTVIKGSNGKYYLYATGGSASNPFQNYSSSDLVHWTRMKSKVISNPPSWLNHERWAPDITKTGSHYTLTFSGGGGGGYCNGSAYRRIGYATASSAAGPFTYQGVLMSNQSKGCGYSIDPNLEYINGGLVLYYGSGGSISASKVTMRGNKLSAGSSKVVLTRSSKERVLVEGSWIIKRGEWYYLFYSSGSYKIKSGSSQYQTNVARSKNPFAFSSGKALITGGNGFQAPGHNTFIADDSGDDWIIYHAYHNNGSSRQVLLDKITYKNGWPVVAGGHPSKGEQTGPATGGTE